MTTRRSQPRAQMRDTRGMAAWISIYQTYNAIFKLTELALLPHELSLPQLHLLGVLRGGGGILTTGEIGREMVKASQTITGLVDRLEVQGFVERQFERRDRRKTWVRITESGSRKLDEAMPVAARIAEELSAVLTDKELADLQAKIQKLREAAMDRLEQGRATLARPQGALAIVGTWREVDDHDLDALIADIYSKRAKDTGRPVALET